ncbi:MAG: DNA alkylation repair protein [Geminicoccaceae bacterium]
MTERRRGARRRSDVAVETLRKLNLGLDETVNLMEWLAVDMDVLARSVFSSAQCGDLGRKVLDKLPRLAGLGITKKLAAVGAAVASVSRDPDHHLHRTLLNHRCDIVRQWAVYALHALPGLPSAERLTRTRHFAADHNMTVRECAWMAFRPHLAIDLDDGINRLQAWVEDADPNVRRFAIEVTRPRSVWGQHLSMLKREPQKCLPLLEPVSADLSRYVRTAVANWLNDASKSRPEWVLDLCEAWSTHANPRTQWIVGRALRSYRRAAEGRQYHLI